MKQIVYTYPDGKTSSATRFPGIAMLEKNVPGKAPVKVVTIRTDDDNGRTEVCYRLFKDELRQLSERLGIDLNIDAEIAVPHVETEIKERSFLLDLFAVYEKGAYIYGSYFRQQTHLN